MRAICPGSFDPVTHGHVDVVRRATGLFEEVVVAVGANTSKSALFSPAERVEMLQEVLADVERVRVTTFSGLLVDYCREHGIGTVVKGLRFAADFDYELQMAQMNSRLSGLETVLLPTSPQWGYVSSSLVREIARLGGDVSAFVPPATARRVAGLASSPEGG
ncbi:pantetheine-phosphate adenylyltransferase [Auraticoccus sp. F435]|uniref:Phosphopantetheine adenylyltransferase n=1 Tax=Auraticoccus cholistanensis TaxID=2656650 RepID=A0A6A9UW34_9ACTN|nr:pantetheine-phosphate adenylyltransferase [Auraticoccus cholistanensis]MVA77126.1 pantetheine-phosphate adenylyltransferase [Auraticoccus cholistanensis]